MLKNIITCIVTCILTCTLAQAATQQEYEQVFNEARAACKVYRTPCSITIVPHRGMFAQTKNDGQIEVSSGLLSYLTQAQVRGVIYHEVGHVVHRDVEKNAEYLYMTRLNNNFNKEFYFSMRRQAELQADRFAIYLGLFTFKDADLIGALIVITPPDEFYKTHLSHPSTADRIKAMERILGR